ncbi:hypothetical protein [Yoonia sp. 208BN28-4]|uniref:hypothetical protein n=1 Tax=Yoonia sp. 208BN28-4 TaxID=3126505 RepID=UPI00309EADF6
MLLRSVLAFALVWLASLAGAQERSFIDFDERMAEARGDADALATLMAEVENGFGGANDFNMVMGDKEWIRVNDVPVRVQVGGDWGNYTVNCKVRLQFVERTNPDGSKSVIGGSWTGGFEAGYRYVSQNDTQTITAYRDDGADDRFETFVSGDMLIGPDCTPGSGQAPEIAENARIKQLQQAELDCVNALLRLAEALAWNAPIPGECIYRNALFLDYAQDIQLTERNIQMTQQCVLESLTRIGETERASAACQAWMDEYSDVIERALGLCDMHEDPSAILVIMDPRPLHFKAQYSFGFQRTDCKTLTVEASFNLAPDDEFQVEAVFPTPDQCLGVDYVRPTLRLAFNQPVRQPEIEEKIRLRVMSGGSAQTVPATISETAPGIVDIAVDQQLEPLTFYWVEIADGEAGLRSASDVALVADRRDMSLYPEVAPLVAAGHRPALWFHTTAVSDMDQVANNRIDVRAGVYQVTRDAQLIRDRPTATRVWFDWQEEEAGDGRTRELCLNLKLTDFASGAPLYPEQEATIKPTDDYTEEELLYAEDSVNFFGWSPTGSETEVVVQATPPIYWHAPDSDAEAPELVGFQDVRHRSDEPVSLTLKYGYLQIADFEDGLNDDTARRLAVHMRAARDYTWQMAPVRAVHLENLGNFTPEALGLSASSQITSIAAAEGVSALTCLLGFCKLSPELRTMEFTNLIEAATKRFAQQYCRENLNACILVVPGLITNHRDVTTWTNGRGIFVSAAAMGLPSQYDLSDDQRSAESLSRWLGNGADAAHEVGHSFGLFHVPLRQEGNDDYKRLNRTGGIFEGIDGIRMATNGNGGHFKSTETGNPETPRFLAPLMFPSLLPTGATHILDDHYSTLARNIYGGNTWGQSTFSDNHPHAKISYTEYERRIMQSRLTLFDSIDPPDILQVARPIGHDPSATDVDEDGIMLRFSIFRDADGARLIYATAPEAVRVAAAPAPEADFLKAIVWAGDTQVAGRGFDLSDDDLQEVSVFMPLTIAAQSDVTRVTLESDDGQTRWEHMVGQLPTGPVTFATTADGSARLTWNAAAPQTQVTVGFDNGEAVTPLGMTTDTGQFDFNLLTAGVVGQGGFVLTFDNGISQTVLSAPASISTPFIALEDQQEGDALQPSLTVRFNRIIAAPLPAFVMTQDGAAIDVPVLASTLSDELFLTPSQALEPCAVYEIRADGQITDINGIRMRTAPVWTIDTTGEDCVTAPAPAASFAQVVMTSDAGERTFDGEVAVDAANPSLVISLPRQQITLALPALEAGNYSLVEITRGESRRDLIVQFATGGTADLTLTEAEGQLQGTFSIPIANGTMNGSFATRP